MQTEVPQPTPASDRDSALWLNENKEMEDMLKNMITIISE